MAVVGGMSSTRDTSVPLDRYRASWMAVVGGMSSTRDASVGVPFARYCVLFSALD
jgi:hypothetical protein